MKFSDIIGHKAMKEHLARSIDGGRVSHAQMFSGEPGYGTLPMALAYVQYLNCTDRREGDSCGQCAACMKISNLAHPDLHFVFPVNSASKSGSQKPTSDYFLPQWREKIASTGGYFDEQEWYTAIDIENQQGIITRAEADEVVRKLSFKSFEARYKTVLIWLPERMRDEAANALLKILEEPWEGTLFLLVSRTPQVLLPTILSRVQQTELSPIEAPALEAYLKAQWDVPSARASEVARLALGDLLTARNMLTEDPAGTEVENLEIFKQLMRMSFTDRHMELIEWAEKVAGAGREEQKALMVYCARMLRNSYMINAGMDKLSYIWGAEEEFCRNFAPYIGNHNIEPLIDEVNLVSAQIAQNGNPRMIFTHFALTISKLIVRI